MRINDILPAAPLAPTGAPAKTASSGFQDLLKDAINRVEGSRAAAATAVEKFITGENQDLHSTVLATQRASLDFDLFLQVRNKVVQSYQEIMRMQL